MAKGKVSVWNKCVLLRLVWNAVRGHIDPARAS
jgi:hypothetical protein